MELILCEEYDLRKLLEEYGLKDEEIDKFIKELKYKASR